MGKTFRRRKNQRQNQRKILLTGQDIHKVSKSGARHIQIVQLERILLMIPEKYTIWISHANNGHGLVLYLFIYININKQIKDIAFQFTNG